jgi:hypothetical protein
MFLQITGVVVLQVQYLQVNVNGYTWNLLGIILIMECKMRGIPTEGDSFATGSVY